MSETKPIPDKVTLDLRNKRLLVDGEEFPWLIAKEPAPVVCAEGIDGLPYCTVTFFTESIEVLPRDGERGEEES